MGIPAEVSPLLGQDLLLFHPFSPKQPRECPGLNTVPLNTCPPVNVTYLEIGSLHM